MTRYGRSTKKKRKLLFHSANIRTLDPVHPLAQAMIVDGGTVTWLGNNEDIVGIPADEYKLINLSGMTVLPAFADAHVHFAFFAQSLSNLSLDGCKSYREALTRVKEFASGLSKSEWLVGKGWAKDAWTDGRIPHKVDLDRIVPDNPAVIYSKDEHVVWVNSLGLKYAGVDRGTPDPDGGEIVRDNQGEPVGLLKENPFMSMFQQWTKPTRKKAFRQIERAMTECHRRGVTAVGNFDRIENFELLQDYHNSRGLKIRIRQYIPVNYLEELVKLRLKPGFGDRYLRFVGTKLFADGALGSQTALMLAPYRGSKTNVGIEATTEAELTSAVKLAATNGIACAIHAIGDRANRHALNSFEKLPRKHRELRHRIEHVQIIHPTDLPRFAQLGIIASVQPSHCSSDIDLMMKYWGAKSRYAYNFRSLLDSGARVAFGSDAPIENIDPLQGIYSAITRKSLNGKKKHIQKQRITIEEAILGFTVWAAYALSDEKLFGVISPGRSADITIMEQDPVRTKPDEVKYLKILATFFEGECVYGRENLEDLQEE